MADHLESSHVGGLVPLMKETIRTGGNRETVELAVRNLADITMLERDEIEGPETGEPVWHWLDMLDVGNHEHSDYVRGAIDALKHIMDDG